MAATARCARGRAVAAGRLDLRKGMAGRPMPLARATAAPPLPGPQRMGRCPPPSLPPPLPLSRGRRRVSGGGGKGTAAPGGAAAHGPLPPPPPPPLSPPIAGQAPAVGHGGFRPWRLRHAPGGQIAYLATWQPGQPLR